MYAHTHTHRAVFLLLYNVREPWKPRVVYLRVGTFPATRTWIEAHGCTGSLIEAPQFSQTYIPESKWFKASIGLCFSAIKASWQLAVLCLWGPGLFRVWNMSVIPNLLPVVFHWGWAAAFWLHTDAPTWATNSSEQRLTAFGLDSKSVVLSTEKSPISSILRNLQ